MYELLGTLGRKFYLKGGPDYNFEQGQIFDQVSKGIDPSPKEIPIDLALYTMTSLEIGDKKYHHLSKTLSKYVFCWLWNTGHQKCGNAMFLG